MALTHSGKTAFGSPAPAFSLPGVDGKTHSLADFEDARALVVVFMCNHCPYVQAVSARINALAREYGPRGVAVAGINPNDAIRYPDDGFEAMRRVAAQQGYVFPYLRDESQEVARAYGAVCTPDFFVYAREDREFRLRYRGRLDDSWKDAAAVKRRELAGALDEILSGRRPSEEQSPSMGCSIKWK